MWYLYVVRCKDGSFYTGITKDVEARIKVHNSPRGAKYTRARRPVVLLYTEEFETKSQALHREIEVKKLGRENKIHLVKFGAGSRFSLAAGWE